ncbi:mediator of RNA polymerase II transcription subunit 1 [Elysia marginata]|uniref:Mediator of RNA polymerase II transcription subunit 1 n=1 Tax=Elysia marginata TaxID=1093978 RepID=A0AAV4JA94_9GAST|nr:mediator of RNA polymerase II transcription subunit 1 [Elysia marginata]
MTSEDTFFMITGRATKKTQGSLIDKLRHKTAHSRSWSDSIKSVCGAIIERKMQTDPAQPESVRGCLDTLQKAMKVISQQTLKERLDMIARQLGLSTQIQNMKISLGTDVFHVDVILGESGLVSSVKLINQGDIVESPDLKDVLRKLKSKAFLALQALEKDLNQLAQFQNSISGVANYIHKCPLGIMLPRLAGKPMKLIYFVSPYDLLDKKTLTAHPLTVEAITENFLGQSVTVCIEPVPESQPANKLQTMPLMNVKTQDGKTLPSFSAVSSINSMMLPASFVLVLPQSIPISTQILQKITASTQLEIHKDAPKKGLRSLILESFSNGKVKDSRKLHVSLPDQQHIYFLDGLNGGTSDQQGVMVSRIPFTHPTHVPQILTLMRQQLLFNIIISSFIRTGNHRESEKSVVFEVTAVTLQQMTIVFEHPVHDSMITVDIDLTDITNLKCSVTCTNSNESLCSDEEISRVFQRCMSIPIMLRWLICKGRGQLDKMKEDALAAERQERALFLKEMQQRQAMMQPSVLPTRGRPPPQPPHPPPLPPPPSYSHLHQSSAYLSQAHANGNPDMNMVPASLSDMRGVPLGLEDFGNMPESNGPHANDGSALNLDSEKAHTPLLSNLLDGKAGKKNTAEVHDSPMLSLLLDDNTSVATTVTPMTTKATPRTQNKRERKRRFQGDTVGPNPKHRFTDNDRISSPSDRLPSIGGCSELDMVPNLMDQGLPSSPSITGPISVQGIPSHHHLQQQQHCMPNHTNKASRSQGNVIDLTEDVGESNLKKLADSVEHLMHNKDVKSEPDLSVLLNEAEAPSRISNILQNSPSGSKNEHASTSLEGFLKGSGEVGRAKDFDPSDAAVPHNSTTFSKLSSLLLASTDSPSSVHSAPPHKANSHFFSDKTFATGGITNSLLMQDIKPNVHKGPLRQSSSMDLPSEMQPCMTGIFEKFDMSRNQQNCKVENSNSNLKPQLSEGKVSLKLKVGPLKQQNNVKQVTKLTSPVTESKEIYRKVNNIGTFDFKSDEDDDDSLAFHDKSLYSASPTIPNSSSKQRHMSDSLVSKKSEKVKKKDKGSGNANKRKRDKEESKREKKRKKSEHHIQDSIYRTVENDGKADIKLKIKVISDKSDSFSDGNVQSYEISKKNSPSVAEKEVSSFKSEPKEIAPIISEFSKEKDFFKSSLNTSKTALTAKPLSHKGPSKSGSSKTVQGGNLSNKTDPKLSTKATIRLKPLTIPNTGSTVNVSQSGSKASVVSGFVSKSDRRSSTTSTASSSSEKRLSSVASSLDRKTSSNLVDRRNSSQLSSVSTSASSASSHNSSSTPTTTVSTSLTLSSILPNAPTTSRIASLPRIPKLSSSSSNTSLNRTSSLDPLSGANPATAGTKSNNSYNTGPAGRANMSLGGTGVNSTSVGNRLPGNANASYNYNRATGPGVGLGSSVRPSYNMARIAGQGHRQGSPVANSGTANLSRSPGIKAPNSSGSFVPGANTSKQSGSVPTNYNIKGNTGSSNHSSQNIAQRTSGNSAKKTVAVNSMSKSNIIPKSILVGSPNNVSSHRHANQNAHGNSGVRTPLSSSSNISRSPNSSAVSKSPSSGKSPNISSNAGRSPSLTSSSRSPSINNPSRSPNINKSPNINSSSTSKSPSTNVNPSRSPNINSSKSPGIANNAIRSSSSSTTTSKPVSHPSSKFPPNVTKASANVNKFSDEGEVTKPVPIYVPQKAMSSSLKTSQVKSSSPKVVSALSSVTVSQQVSSRLVNATVSSPSPPNKISNAAIPEKTFLNQVSSESVQKQTSSQLSTTCPSTTVENQKSSVTLASGRPFQQGSTQSSIGSNVQISASDTLNGISCASSTPTTPKSADGAKKFSFPASRGRKSSCSLSAIVDKLKHNAAGAGLDSTQNVVTHGENYVSKSLCVEDKVKNKSLELSSGTSCATDIAKDSRVSSPKQIDNVNKSPVMNSVAMSKPKSPIAKSPLMNMPINCEIKRDAQPEASQTVLKANEDTVKNVEMPDSTNLQNFKGSSPQQCSVPDPSFVLPFQHQSSVNISQNTSRTASLTSGLMKGSSDNDQQLFKVPTVKPVNEQPMDDGNKTTECGLNNKLNRVEVEGAKSGENQEIKEKRTSGGERRTSGPVKSLASPLSDISSPENGLIIDDEESPQRISKPPADVSASVNSSADINSFKPSVADLGTNTSKLSGFVRPPKLESDGTDGLSSKESGSSPQNSLYDSTPQASPKTAKPVSAKSPALSKAMSGGSTPKGSDSPCEIDDDLMDEALGFGS